MRTRYKILIIISAAILVVAAMGYGIGYGKIARKLSSIVHVITLDRSSGEKDFPPIDTSELSTLQKKIVQLTKKEFENQTPGTKFSEGHREPWCSDFVSWVMKNAGDPFTNPVSGSWRIPGTYTLLDYYKQNGAFRDVHSGYTPKLGDVAIYNNSPVFGDHTNFVLRNDGGVLTTVGGNENGRIRVYQNTQKQYDGLLGYGVND